MRGKESSCLVVSPYDPEVYCSADKYAREDYCRLGLSIFQSDYEPDHPRQQNHYLNLTWWEPSPVKASFICNYIIGEKVACHHENGPPVLLAIAEALLVGKPTRSISQPRSNLPSEKEDKVVYWCKTQVSVEQRFEVIGRSCL